MLMKNILAGSFRFHQEFAQAVKLISSGDVEAFELANDRSRAMKVQLSFQG